MFQKILTLRLQPITKMAEGKTVALLDVLVWVATTTKKQPWASQPLVLLLTTVASQKTSLAHLARFMKNGAKHDRDELGRRETRHQ